MKCDESEINEYIRETVAGQCAVVAALVEALDRAHVLPRDKFKEALNRAWVAMPEAVAVSATGAVIKHVLNLLCDDACDTLPSADAALRQLAPTVVGRPIDDDVAA